MAVQDLSVVHHPALRVLLSSAGQPYSHTTNEQLIAFLRGRGLRLLMSIPELSADRLIEVFLKMNEPPAKDSGRVIGMIRNQIVMARKRLHSEFERLHSYVPPVQGAKETIEEKIEALEEAIAEMDAQIKAAQLELNYALAMELLLLMADLLAKLVELREQLTSHS